jgi:cytochrome P450
MMPVWVARGQAGVLGRPTPWDTWPPQRAVSGYLECRAALTDPGLTTDPYFAGVTDRPSHNLLLMEGHEHKVLRSLIAPFMTPEATALLAPSLSASCNRHLGRLLEVGHGDLIADVVEPLVFDAVCLCFGVPSTERSQIRSSLSAMLGSLEPAGSPQERAPQASTRIMRIMHKQATDADDDGLYRQILDARASGTIGKGAARFTMPVVLHGAYENPLNYLGHIVATAVEDPEAFATAARRWRDGVREEILRLMPPVRGVLRWNRVGAGIGSGSAGEPLWIDLESANRDQGQLDPPTTANYARPARHLSFGYGTHRCPGVNLARLLGSLVIDGLLQLPDRSLSTAIVERHIESVTQGVTKAMVIDL